MRFLLFIFFPILLCGQSAQYREEIFTRENGLPSDVIYNIKQDHTGFLWLATAEGLSRFDGKQFKTFYLPPEFKALANVISDLEVLPDNRMALATHNGLFIFDLKQYNFTKINLERNNTNSGINDNVFNHLLFDNKKNQLWVGSYNGIHIFDTKKNKFIHSFYAEPNWILKDQLSFAHAFTFAPDSSVFTWINKAGVYRWVVFDTASNKLTDITSKLPESVFDSLHLKKLIPPEMNTITASFKLIYRGFKDNQNTFWGLGSDGLHHFYKDERKFQPIDSLNRFIRQINSESTGAIYLTDKTLWIGTSNAGVLKYNLATKKTIQWRPGTRFKNYYADLIWNFRLNDDNKMWLGFGYGFCSFDTSTFKAERINLPNKPAVFDQFNGCAQFEDSRKNLWFGIGGGNGLVQYITRSKELKHYKPVSQGGNFPLRHPMCVAEDEYGDLWFGTQRGGGLAQWHRMQDSFSVILPQINSEFENDIILDIISDRKGNLWLSVFQIGLVKFDIKTKQFKKYGVESGLKTTNVSNLLLDKSGNIWVGTVYGLYSFDTIKKKFEFYDTKDGLVDNYINCIKQYGDSIFVADTKGVSIFEPENFKIRQKPSKIVLTNFLVSNHEKFLGYSRKIELSFTENNLQIEFAVLDFIRGRDARFAYRLIGADTTWIDIGDKRMVNFINLNSGNYKFQVKAAYNSDNWGIITNLLDIEISPPWWKTSWFAFVLICLIGFVFWLLYKFRLNQLLHLQKVRNDISRDLHDDIGATLSNINILRMLVGQKIPEIHPSHEFLNRIDEEVKHSTDALDDIIWNVNPLNDSMDQLMARMRRYAVEVFEAQNINFIIDLPDETTSLKLDMSKRRDFWLIYKEALHNLIKYSMCSKVEIKLITVSQKLILTIEDNGIGFDTSTQIQGNGLRTMPERAQKMKGNLKIISKVGKGTIVQLEIPIGKKK